MELFKLYFCEYNLVREGTQVPGILLRLEEGCTISYGVVHPWTIYDGLSYQELLRLLTGMDLSSTNLRSALLQALMYGNPNQWIERGNVKSHLLVSSTKDWGDREVDSIFGGGFRSIKVKIHESLSMRLLELMHFMGSLAPDIRLRLDFNAKFSREEVVAAFSKLKKAELDRIDFVEDPYLGELSWWVEDQKRFGLSFARDWMFRYEKAENNLLKIVKPNLESNLIEDRELEKVVVTSYLAHPLEQLLAQSYAEDLHGKGVEVLGGMCSHEFYEPTVYSRCLDVIDSVLILKDKKCFIEALEKEDWNEVGVFERQKILGF